MGINSTFDAYGGIGYVQDSVVRSQSGYGIGRNGYVCGWKADVVKFRTGIEPCHDSEAGRKKCSADCFLPIDTGSIVVFLFAKNPDSSEIEHIKKDSPIKKPTSQTNG